MESVGSYLQFERVSRGVHLDEIAAHTRIGAEMLEALEQDRMDELPGGVFTVSFVRQYCRFIGVDEEFAVAKLNRGKPEASFSGSAVEDGAREPLDPLLAKGAWDRIKEEAAYAGGRYGAPALNVTFGLALILGGLFGYQALEERGERIAAEQATEARDAADRALAARRNVESFTTTGRRRMPIELELEIVETVWVRALADGERVLEEILRPGDRRPIFAEEQVDLRVGNAGGLLLALNGEPLPPIGPRGQVRRVTVTPDGMQIVSQPPVRSRLPGARESVRVPVTTASLRWAELGWVQAID